jgi:hypothetical protein
VTSPSYCAPCIADLALVREAVTSVAGTASCMAHAVLLTHSSDDAGRRRQRLDALRDLANSKAEAADPAEQARLELLVQEYGLAGAMDMGGPARRAPQGQGQPGQGERRPKNRRGRGRGEGGPGQGYPGQAHPGPGQRDRRPAQVGAGETQLRGAGETAPGSAGEAAPVAAAAAAPAPDGGTEAHGETVPVTPAPGPSGEGAGGDAPASSSGEQEQRAADPTPAVVSGGDTTVSERAAGSDSPPPPADPAAVPPTSAPDA